MSEEPSVLVDPSPDRLAFLPIDPFAAMPDVASTVKGLGGDRPGNAGYVFQSLDIYPVLGPVEFLLQFHDLTATTGTLTVRICAFSLHPGTAPVRLRDVVVPMCEVAGNGGLLTVEMTSRRNMGYTIGGSIDDVTDTRATMLSLSLYPRERDAALPGTVLEKPPVEAPDVARSRDWVERPELATMRPVTLAQPVSQAMTAAQACDPLVVSWNAALHQSGGNDVERWENAFILQALHHYGVATDGGSGLGMGRHRRRLPAYLAGRGCTILAAGLDGGDLPEGDPGLALERLVHADLCSPRRFFEAVHLTLFEDMAIPPALTGFDFLWSTDAASGPGARARVPQMLRDSMRCLRPGGIAVHVLRYSGALGTPADPHSSSYGRVEIERMALSLVADGQEVAQLSFAVDGPDRPGDRHTPFGLVARRIR